MNSYENTNDNYKPSRYVSDDEIYERIFQWSPPVEKMLHKGTLREYFAKAAAWKPKEELFVMKDTLKDELVAQTEYLYGSDTAEKLSSQLDKHFISETGTHLAFPRDIDRPNSDLGYHNDLAAHGLVVSASLYRDAGMPFHLGLYSSNIPIANTNGPLQLQLTNDSFDCKVTSNKRASTMVNSHPPIAEDAIQELEKTYHKHLFDIRKKEMLETIKASAIPDGNLKTVNINFLSKDQEISEKALSGMEKTEAYLESHGYKVDRHESEYQRIADVMEILRKHSDKTSMVEQVAVAQSYLTNCMFPDDVRQITLDFSTLVENVMVKSLENKNSMMHQIFSDKELRDDFVNSLAHVRSGWGQFRDTEFVESPFLGVKKSSKDNSTKLIKFPYNDETTHLHTPEGIVEGIKSKEISPTGIMSIAFIMMDTGMLVHGGMFQCQYVADLREKMVGFMKKHDFAVAGELERMPIDVTMMTSGVFTKDEDRNTLWKYSDIVANGGMSKDDMDALVETNPKELLDNAAATLHNFFTAYAPDMTDGVTEAVMRDTREEKEPSLKVVGLRM